VAISPLARPHTWKRPGIGASPVRMTDRPFLSVAVPVYNESGNVEPLLQRLKAVLSEAGVDHEVIIVDDGSDDGTWTSISSAITRYPFVRAYRLSRNFGHQNALFAALAAAKGDVVVSMDGDLQHSPEVIVRLLAKWREGFEIVNTRRLSGRVTGFFKRSSSALFYRVFSALAEVDVSEGSSDFRLLDRKVLDALLKLRDGDLFLRGSVHWLGFKTTTVEFQVAERHSGQSKYNLRKMLRFASGAVVSFSTKPLRIGIWVGLLTSLIAFLEIFYILVQVYRGRTVPGWASTVGITSLLFGILFVLVGIIGVYVARIHTALQRRPYFIVAESIWNTDGDSPAP